MDLKDGKDGKKTMQISINMPKSRWITGILIATTLITVVFITTAYIFMTDVGAADSYQQAGVLQNAGQAQQFCQMLDDPFVWASFPPEVRYQYMMLFAPSIAVSAGLPVYAISPANVRIMSPYDESYGFADAYCDYPTKTVYLNMEQLAKRGAREAIKTMAHEIRHVWQETTQSIPYTPVDITDFNSYMSNPREADAMKYASWYIDNIYNPAGY